jgi:hypothetical protein
MTKALDRLARAQKELCLAQEEFQNENTEAEKNKDWIIRQAVAVGMSESRANLHNAKLTIEKTLRQHLALETDLESWAQNLGYDSFARARMGMGARTNRHDLVVEQLPVAYQKIPIKLALNKSNLELGRIERTIRRTQSELLDAFENGVSEVAQAEIADAWSNLETLADLEGFYTDLIKFNNNYEEPKTPETVPTSAMLTRLELADKFSVMFIADVTAMIRATPVEIERKESIYRTSVNPNNLVEFVLWQHLANQMDELLFLRHMSDFAIYLEEKGLAVPQGKTLENSTTASAGHRYDWKWVESVCLNDLLNYFAINGIEVTDFEATEEALEIIEETEEELLGCL